MITGMDMGETSNQNRPLDSTPRAIFGIMRNDLVARLALAALALPIAFVSLADTIANVVVGANPSLAYRLAPWDGRARAAFAASQFLMKPTGDLGSDVSTNALQAIRQDPTALDALNVLGAQAQLRQRHAEAKAIFEHDLRLSQRELPARLWAIEEAAALGDIAASIDNYDVALRTSSKAPDLLFPILDSAISEPRIRRELVRVWRARPQWSRDFIDYAASNSRTPQAVIALLAEAHAIGVRANAANRVALVGNLVNGKQLAAAWRYYSSFSKGARATESRDPEFLRDPAKASMFDWSVTEYASIQREQGGTGVVELAVPPAVSGPLLQQLQVLPPGRYILSSVSSGIEQPDTSLPLWEIRCAGGQVLKRIELPPSAENQLRKLTAEFVVPADCGAQFLTLFARSTDLISGVKGRIKSARVTLAR